MDKLRFWKTYLVLTMGRLRRQLWLLAGLALLCFLLPFGVGEAARETLERGVEFSGVTLALTAPEGDDTPELLERYMGGMEDIAQYCRMVTMEEGEALEALAEGRVTAVLALPQDFIQGVMWGENPDLRLIVARDRPLEALLLLWVGQSATDILSGFQSGVYAVLELYDKAPPPELDRQRVLIDINLRYITLALDRNSMFALEELEVTGALPIALHYVLSLLSYFALAAAPVFLPLYTGSWMAFQRRLRGVRGYGAGLGGALAAATAVLTALLLPALLLTGEGALLARVGAAVLMAGFASLFAAVCCLVAGNAAECGQLAFSVALAALLLGGGAIPPALLPGAVRELLWLSPVTWLRQLAAGLMGYGVSPGTWACLGLAAGAMGGAARFLYGRRAERGEGAE